MESGESFDLEVGLVAKSLRVQNLLVDEGISGVTPISAGDPDRSGAAASHQRLPITSAAISNQA